MPTDRLCVFGCVTKGVTIHRFPNPEKYPERFRKWVDLAGLSTITAVKTVEPTMNIPSCVLQQVTGVTALDEPGPSMYVQPKPSLLSGTRKKSQCLHYYKTTQKQIRNLRSEICRLKRKNKNFKSRLADAEKLSMKKSFENVTKSMSLPSRLLTNMQFRESAKKPKGRRFTTEEKILAMALYKRSPKSYSLLYKCFTLPSAKSLRNLLGRIKIKPGINTLQ
ncbi:unnamed protein product [Colias eurytheme]|nr:unnamed protein product [Colias eurytheme]